MRAQPDKRLDCDDRSYPYKGPFWPSDVLVVELLRVDVSKDDGPYDHEWPDICMEVKRHCGTLDICQISPEKAYEDCGESSSVSADWQQAAPCSTCSSKSAGNAL